MLFVRPELPVDPPIVAVLGAVHAAATALNVDYFLVGATARDVLLTHVFGRPPGRATRDVDFALAVADWAAFGNIKDHLQSTGKFVPDARALHRLRFNNASYKHAISVDLVPFGGVANAENVIAWPPDMAIIMNVTGFSDALRAAVLVQIEHGLVVKVASFSGLSLLKLIAWKDRRAEDPKDAIDFVLMLRNYEHMGNQDRIYGEALSALERVDYDPELAGAWLLGRDAAEIAAATTRSTVAEIMQDAAMLNYLITDMAKALRGREDSITYATVLAHQFREGFSFFTAENPAYGER